MCGRGKRRKFKNKNGQDMDDGFNKWGGYMAAKRAKLLDQFHSDNIEKISDIFAGIRILVNGLTHPPAAELKNLMAAHGGEYHMYQSSSTTHIVASNLPNVKIKHLGAIPVVKPEWITESIALNKLLDYGRYLLYTNQSRLQPALKFPVVAKSSTVLSIEQDRLHGTTDDATVIKETDHNLDEKCTDALVAQENSINLNKEVDINSTINKNETNVLKNVGVTASSTMNSRVTKTASDPRFLEEFYSNSRLHLISTLGAEFKQLVGQLREKSDGKFSGREKLIAGRDKGNVGHHVPTSIIMHIDMDCFFVSVGLRNHPELRGQPVAITHARSGVINSNDPNRQAVRDQEFALYEERLPEGATSRIVDITEKIDGLASMSEIASCSYEARKYGIKNGMFLGQAIKQCPGLKTLPYDFEGYKEVSNTLYNTVASYTLDIEAVSCDEMYVDVKQILLDTGLTVEEWATHIRNEIMSKTGCPCSTGFGANRLQARLATRKAKPAGQYYLKRDEVDTYMSDIPLADLPGVGRATLTRLRNLGYDTCGDLQSSTLKILQSELGNKLGERIWEQAHGNDNKPLDFNHERKSVSAEINYGIRFKTKEECYNFLQSLANEVFNRLSDVNLKARGLTLKLLVRAEGAPVETAKFLGHGVCDAITKSSTTSLIFSSAEIIFKEAKAIYDKLNVPFAELRGVGIQLTKLEKIAPVNKALSNFLKQGAIKKVPENASMVSTSNNENDRTAEPAIRNETPLKAVSSGAAKKVDGGLENTQNRQFKELGNSLSNVRKNSNKETVSNAKSRGRAATRGKRGKKNTTDRTMQTFLERPRNGKLSNNKLNNNENTEDEAALLKLRDQIDLDVLSELPEDIRKEIMKEYRFDLTPKTNSKSQKTSSSTQAQIAAQNKLEMNQSETIKAQTDASTVPAIKHSPFANQSWEEIKQGIKIWIKAENSPANVDVEMLANHLRQLALDRRIELLQAGFNFLHRTFTNLNCSWHQAYFSMVDAVQQGMVARYGKILSVQTSFFCCQIH